MLPEVQELISSNGNVRLAAERAGVSPTEFVSRILAGSPDDLIKAVKMSTLLQLLDLISNYKIALIASLDEMSPRDTATSFENLLSNLHQLTSEHSARDNNMNVLQVYEGDQSSARERLLSRFISLSEPATTPADS